MTDHAIQSPARLRERVHEGLTWSERWENLRAVYGTKRIRAPKLHTAIGWKPDDSYTEVRGQTASDEREYVKKAEQK